MGIAEAREAARAAIKRIRAGLAPVEPAPPVEDSVEDVAQDRLKRHAEKNGFRSAGEARRVIETHVLPHWRARPFISIRRSDIAALLDKIEDENGPSAADHVLSITRAIANWYSARHDFYAPPFVRRMARTDPEQRKRSRVLDDEELRKVWKAAGEAGTFGALIRTLLLTAQRREPWWVCAGKTSLRRRALAHPPGGAGEREWRRAAAAGNSGGAAAGAAAPGRQRVRLRRGHWRRAVGPVQQGKAEIRSALRRDRLDLA